MWAKERAALSKALQTAGREVADDCLGGEVVVLAAQGRSAHSPKTMCRKMEYVKIRCLSPGDEVSLQFAPVAGRLSPWTGVVRRLVRTTKIPQVILFPTQVLSVFESYVIYFLYM